MKTTRNVAIGLLLSDWKGLTHVNEFFICPTLNSYLFSVHISSHDFIQVIHAIEFFIIETENSSRTDQKLYILILIESDLILNIISCIRWNTINYYSSYSINYNYFSNLSLHKTKWKGTIFNSEEIPSMSSVWQSG